MEPSSGEEHLSALETIKRRQEEQEAFQVAQSTSMKAKIEAVFNSYAPTIRAAIRAAILRLEKDDYPRAIVRTVQLPGNKQEERALWELPDGIELSSGERRFFLFDEKGDIYFNSISRKSMNRELNGAFYPLDQSRWSSMVMRRDGSPLHTSKEVFRGLVVQINNFHPDLHIQPTEDRGETPEVSVSSEPLKKRRKWWQF